MALLLPFGGRRRAALQSAACGSYPHAGAFAEASIVAARCQVGLAMTDTARATLEASAEVLGAKGFDDLARAVRAEGERLRDGGE